MYIGKVSAKESQRYKSQLHFGPSDAFKRKRVIKTVAGLLG